MKNLPYAFSGVIIFSTLLASCSFIQNSPFDSTHLGNENSTVNTAETLYPSETETEQPNEIYTGDNSIPGNPIEQPLGNEVDLSEPPSRYSITATMDYDNHQISVNQSILFTNYSKVLLFELVLAAEPNLCVGCFLLESVKVNEVDAVYTLDGDRLEIPLAVPLATGETLELILGFSLNLPAVNSGHLFGYNYFETTLVDWYPFIVPYRDGWVLHSQSEVGESLVYETAYFDVSLIFNESAQTLSVAASAPGEEIGNR